MARLEQPALGQAPGVDQGQEVAEERDRLGVPVLAGVFHQLDRLRAGPPAGLGGPRR
jgi:hypothetical protein